MTLYIGADHAGWKLKEAVKKTLAKTATIHDLSPVFMDGDDYPTIGKALAKKVAASKTARGLLFCGSGTGVAIAANRVKGARAMEASDAKQIKVARNDEDINILTLGGREITAQKALPLIKTFLTARASSAERHRRRVKQLG